MRETYAAMGLIALAGTALAGDSLAPPSSTQELFEFHATGVQIYACEEKPGERAETRFVWNFAAPEAVLYDSQGKQAGTHAKGPSWTLDDGSSVTGELVAKQPSPKSGAIPWLLLKVASHRGAGRLDGVSFIRRVETTGGVAPESGCDGEHQGTTARVPYTAAYQFFGG